MVKKLLTALSLGSALITAQAQAQGAYGLFNLDSYDYTHSYNVDDIRSIASITKLFTAVTVLNSGVDLDQQIPVVGKSTTKLPPGSRWSRRDLMRAMLISSDNRSAESLAHAHPGGYDQFLKDANDLIKSMNLTNTEIVDATGLLAGNRSSVQDLKEFLFYLRRVELLKEFSSERQHQLAYQKGRRTITVNLRNTNPALWTYDNILISKTGFTNAAGRCVAMLVEKGGELYAVIVLGQRSTQDRTMVIGHLLENKELRINNDSKNKTNRSTTHRS